MLEGKKDPERNGSHLHVNLAFTRFGVGTLRQSIHMALESLVERAMTLVGTMTWRCIHGLCDLVLHAWLV
jgi:hypothetical protein